MKKRIYLDYAAATPLDPEVLKAMHPYLTARFYNPSATYLGGRSVRKSLEDARDQVAVALGAKPTEIIFTAGATEANNLAIQGVMEKYPDSEVVVSAIEHESVLSPTNLFKRQVVPVNKQGVVEIEELKKLINDKTVLVSIIMVSN